MAETYDAAMVPAGYPTGTRDASRHLALRAEFGPLFGSDRVNTRALIGGLSLVLPHPVPAGDDPTEGPDRFDWTDRGDGVMLGRKKARA